MNKRGFMSALALTLFLTTGASYAQGQYPTKPIRMIVPYAAGGGLDALTRVLAQGMSETLGQSIVIENKVGAGGMIGAEFVARSVSDGYTLLMAGNPELVISPHLLGGNRYNVSKDFVPIMLAAESPNIIAAHPSLKASLRDIVQNVPRGDGPLTIGSPGQGSPQHLTIEALKSLGKAEWVHAPYKGAGPAIVDTLGGQTQLVLSGAPPLLPHLRSGKLKALAVTQPQRSALMPDIPTVAEATGLKGLDSYSTWYGLLAPAGTPQGVVETLHKAIAGVLARPEVRQKLQEMGTEVVALSNPGFAERIQSESKRYHDVIRRFNIQPN